MKTYYYIGDKCITLNPSQLSIGVRIHRYTTSNYFMKFEKMDGPYDSIKELRKNSMIFKELAKTDTSRAQKILQEKNIVNVKDLIITNNKDGYSKDFIKLFEHTIKGDIKSNRISGIHFFDKRRMKIIEIIRKEDKNFVWRALVEIYDNERNSKFQKESDFFPRNWSLSRLFEECEFAYNNRIKDIYRKNIFIARTLSGVPVEIAVQNEIIKSIYPIFEL